MQIFLNKLNFITFLLFKTFLLLPGLSFAENSKFSKLSSLEKDGNATVSALVVKLSDGEKIAELNADLKLCPASVTKLVLGAQALDKWGTTKTFSTKLFARGKINKGTLDGDIIFYGGGDASLTNEKLWFLTTDVARYGIKKITGKIVVNNSLFGKVLEDENRLGGKTKSHNAYDAPLSSAAVNFSVIAIVVSPNEKVGGQAKISLEPYPLNSVVINGSVTTTSENSPPQVSVSRQSKNGKDIFSVSGNIPKNSTAQRIYRSISNADRYAGEVLNGFLTAAGIETSGEIEIDSKELKGSLTPIAAVDGYPIEWQMKGLFEVSNNFIGDILALNLLSESNPKNKGDLKEAGSLLEKYMKNVLKNSTWETNQKLNSPIIIESGSGLTPNNRLSARDIISLLDHMYFSGRAFPAYINALPIVGDEGTLKRRFTSASEKHLQGRLRGKTGTLTEPVNVSALGGYSRLKNGDWVAFAVIVNGVKSKPQPDLKNIRDAIDSDLAKVLPSEL
ncbi:D-alanyl-D-alanine carboxypeptidase/D-alanyl-D-alanine-endopeptidase [Pigmentibacter sp. JX0631]|uniref:D-alanyl-D-alanine carboxypeptidase/D-alanyl-D-alanine endopeptidase n=1 Tax=Pigmentibacter sp. JX0631 TaxID=2976982 RepID=UPI0024690042|nr:D-alanyl-D-alanine carboxypeptidase/D-alanyl-D-alanine-endopeptidase [Pigmentibacter sp. JX0631]WGL58661.1 D-alanyl-D-alanine carboxypeptidase/D-alanyl-D-alanine-endopeptidase [Pigmentibacter sp. JX0631]